MNCYPCQILKYLGKGVYECAVYKMGLKSPAVAVIVYQLDKAEISIGTWTLACFVDQWYMVAQSKEIQSCQSS